MPSSFFRILQFSGHIYRSSFVINFHGGDNPTVIALGSIPATVGDSPVWGI